MRNKQTQIEDTIVNCLQIERAKASTYCVAAAVLCSPVAFSSQLDASFRVFLGRHGYLPDERMWKDKKKRAANDTTDDITLCESR